MGVPFDIVQGWGVLWEDLASDIALLQALQPNDELANGDLNDIGVYYNGWEVELPSSDQVFTNIPLLAFFSLLRIRNSDLTRIEEGKRKKKLCRYMSCNTIYSSVKHRFL